MVSLKSLSDMPSSQISRALYQLRLNLQLLCALTEFLPINEYLGLLASSFPREDYSIVLPSFQIDQYGCLE